MYKSILVTATGLVIFISTFTHAATYSGGDGTETYPYKIANKTDLLILAATTTDYTKCFILTDNIDLAGETFTHAVISPDTDSSGSGFQGTAFTGVFDGGGYIISNLIITEPDKDYIGLFGCVGNGGQIRKLGAENVNITGHDYVGGLAGKNYGDISNCYSTGFVTGGEYSDNIGDPTSYKTGGLVGHNLGSLTACYSSSTIFNEGVMNMVGGLVGANNGAINTSYVTDSDVEGKGWSSRVGGLVGYNDGYVSKCYATGSLCGTEPFDNIGGLTGLNFGTLSICYASCWISGRGEYSDIGGLVGENASDTLNACFCTGINGVGQGISTGVTSKTATEMKMLSTFTDAGWDFSITDGDAADWQMPSNGYPQLTWVPLPMPIFYPDGGAYSSAQRVTMTCIDDSVTIHYTTNGIDPTENDLTIGGGDSVMVSVDPLTTLKARAFKHGSNPSNVKTAIYTALVGTLNIQKCTAKAGKMRGLDSIQFSGLLDVTEADISAAGNIFVEISADDMPALLDWTFAVDGKSYKKGKFNARNATGSLNVDTKTGKMSFSAKNVDLTGLSCPVTATVIINNYEAAMELDEAIVNGNKKPCPIQLLQGIKNTLDVTKSSFKKGKTSGTDSLTVSGTFTVAADYIKAPLSVIVGNQTFTVPIDKMGDKNNVASCNAKTTGGITAKLDYNKCTFTVSIKNADITQSGTVEFGINCFGVSLEGLATVKIN